MERGPVGIYRVWSEVAVHLRGVGDDAVGIRVVSAGLHREGEWSQPVG